MHVFMLHNIAASSREGPKGQRNKKPIAASCRESFIDKLTQSSSLIQVVAFPGKGRNANPARNYSVLGAFPGVGPRATVKGNLTRNPSLENNISCERS